MKVVSIPKRLRLRVSLLGLFVPMAAMQVIAETHAPWWRLPYASLALWTGVSAAAALIFGAALATGRKWTWYLVAFTLGVWSVTNLFTAARTSNASLAFFTLVLMLLSIGVCAVLRHELARSYFDPGLQWYHGLPKAIPELQCQISASPDEKRDFRVSRIDHDGVFVFLPAAQAATDSEWVRKLARDTGMAELLFSFRERQVRCQGQVIGVLERGPAAGIRFSGMTPDARKNLGDFVEILRGEGHVQ